MTDSNHQSTLSKQQIDAVVALYSNGQYQEAIAQIKVLNEAYPNVPFLFNLIGACYKSLGQLEGSVKMFQTAVTIKPDYAEAHKNLGIVLQELGRLDDSVDSLQNAIAINPDYIDAHYNLANILKELGQHDDAVRSYEKLIEIKPDYAEAYNNLGNLYKDLDRKDDAIKSFLKAIALNPNFTHAYNNLGTTLADLGRLDEAIENYKKAIDLNANFAESHNNLGNAFKERKNLNDAIKCYKDALVINPNFAQALYNLGSCYKKNNQKEKALPFFERAWTLKPDMDFILGDLLATLMGFCFWDDYHELLNQIKFRILNNEKVIHPFNLLGLIDDPYIQQKATKIFVQHHYPENSNIPKIDSYKNHLKIRIGYFSADFHNHATMHLMAELFEYHDKSCFEFIAFSFGPDQNDKWRQRAISSFDHFIDVRLKSDHEVALISRAMEIDIAIDLKGYTRGCRPNIFALKCAPIQVNYLGFPGTMGADYIDYLIADKVLIPKKNQPYYSEKIVYMPDSYQSNVSERKVSKVLPSRQELGLTEKGFVFCCFNNNYKISIITFKSWMKILEAVDGSVIWLFENNKVTSENLKKEAAKLGINEDRIIFATYISVEEHLNRIQFADLFIDTLPYNAHTTSSDSLRMGIPVITLIGKSFASRVAASLLNSVNLPELITNTQEEYESLAIELANNPERLKAIKDKLKSNLPTAPLFDTKLFAKNIESAYTQMYERHQKGLEPDHIYVE